MYRLIFLSFVLTLTGCNKVSSEFIANAKGSAGEHTPIPVDTEGNIYGYYEYLPEDFNAQNAKKWPLIFFWNGMNALTGEGSHDLSKLLNQGLPNLIHNKHDFPAIIISGMLPTWNKDDIHPFVQYILSRYEQHINPQKIYMTGFSAGGGVTLRYTSEHPEQFAAIVPIAPAAKPPKDGQPSLEMSRVASWFFHNSGDMTVEIWRSNIWHKALKDLGGDHRITRPDLDSHYAWEAAYTSPKMWSWLLSQSKTNSIASNINE